MARWRRTTACERAAQWISLELDDALGELERAALQRHLARCATCSGARAEIAGFTLLLRSAPLVERRRPVSVGGVGIPRRARLVRRAAASLVLAAALAAGGAVVLAPRGSPTASSTALALATPSQRLEFARAEHARIEVPTPAPAPAPQRQLPYGARALA